MEKHLLPSDTRLETIGFRADQAATLIGVTYRQLDYWARTDLLTPSLSLAETRGQQRLYSYQDLVLLRVIKRFLDAGLSLAKIRRAVRILREHLSEHPEAYDVTVVTDGETIRLARSEDDVVELFRQGRAMFGIAVAPVAQEIADSLDDVNPPAEQEAREELPSTDESTFVEQVASLLRDRMLDAEADWRAGGESLSSLGAPEAFTNRLLASVPHRSPWDDRVGPFFTTKTLRHRLGGISRQAVLERRQRGSILGLRTSDGVWVYPSWQFLDDGRPIPGLQELIAPFVERDIDGWEIAGWLESTFKELGGASPKQFLITTGQVERMVPLAQDAASRLSS